MKNTERVKELIAELKSNAETDFEHHRIAVLERDLANPLVATRIDDVHQEFNGIVYRRKKNKHYTRSEDIHRAVYSYYYGNIPTDKLIHHIDHNPANNDISNLQMLTKAEHRRLHNREASKKAKMICEQCGKEYTRYNNGQNRFCSAKCKAKHPDYAEKYTKICPSCEKEFITCDKRRAFCSRSCAQAFGHKGHSIQKICPICGKSFRTSLSADRKTCSTACGQKLSAQKRGCASLVKTCPICGKTFKTKPSANCKTCSTACGYALRSQKNRKS